VTDTTETRTYKAVRVEKGGWLDQILLAILGFLNQSWLSITVALVGGGLVAYLGRVSPKEDWEYLKDGPGKVLSVAFLLLAAAKSAPRKAGSISTSRMPPPLTRMP